MQIGHKKVKIISYDMQLKVLDSKSAHYNKSSKNLKDKFIKIAYVRLIFKQGAN